MNEKIKIYDEKMQKTIDHLEADYQGIRAGRANPHVLDKLKVDYYGTPTAIQQVANVNVPEPRMIQIQPWEASMVKEIEKAILTSDLGSKSADVSEDEVKELEDGAQKMTDKYITEIDKAVEAKTKEILTV